MKFYAIKKHGIFEPVDDSDEQKALKIPIGATVQVSYSESRNYAYLKMYHQFIDEAFNIVHGLGEFQDPRVFRLYIQMQAGHFTTIISPRTGEPIYLPKSINFDSMEQKDFEILTNRILDRFLELYSDKMTPAIAEHFAGFFI